MRIYLDVSCLNRPFDDQGQARVRLESEAVIMILETIGAGTWDQVSSRMAEIEAEAIKDEVRRRRVLELLPADKLRLTSAIIDRARQLVGLKLKAADATHLAAAEAAQANVFLTCDDRLLRGCRRISGKLEVSVANPLEWFQEQSDATNPG